MSISTVYGIAYADKKHQVDIKTFCSHDFACVFFVCFCAWREYVCELERWKEKKFGFGFGIKFLYYTSVSSISKKSLVIEW